MSEAETLVGEINALWEAYAKNCAGLDDLGHWLRLNAVRVTAALTPRSETVDRNAVIEECAVEAEQYGEAHYDPYDPGYVDVAPAIRALKEKK